MSFTRAEAVRLIKAHMAYYGVSLAQLRKPRERTAVAVVAAVALPQPDRATPPPKPVAGRARPPGRPLGRVESVVVAPPRALASAQVVETPATVRTVCLSLNHDPRYQCEPGKPVEGAGFVREWRSRRG